MSEHPLAQVARDAGLNPHLIPAHGSFEVRGKTIRYRYVQLDENGNTVYDEDEVAWTARPRLTEWRTAKVGGAL